MTKTKVLAWLDGPSVATGFGVVAKNVLKPLWDTGKYDIEQIAINYKGNFVNRDLYPWQMQPAAIHKADDPHGCELFVKTVFNGDYDMIFICNDLHVTSMVVEPLRQVLDHKRSQSKKVPKIIYYYPVDCHVMDQYAGMLDLADKIVAYNEHGKAETLKVKPYLEPKISVIHHGVNTEAFKPFSRDIQNQLKAGWLKVDPQTFVFISVNRNSSRKQLARTIYLFSEFKKKVPKSIMYMHTAMLDTTIDLTVALRDLGLSMKTDVVFPQNYSPGKGVSDAQLNEFYNMADCFITNHLGEGWGLTVTEAMAAGVPVIAPYNTSMPTILGENSERGFMYPCKDTMYVDNSGYRPCGLQEDILAKMFEVHNIWKNGIHKYQVAEVSAAREWVEQNTWQILSLKWQKLIEEVMAGQSFKSTASLIV